MLDPSDHTSAEIIVKEFINQYGINDFKNLDLLCGGPPCQGFSMIGRAKHGTIEERAEGFINDSRNTWTSTESF